MAHTPGPWRAVATEIVSTALPDDDCVVADVLSQDYDRDASLIAAAPELLAVCKAIASDLSLFQFTDGEYRLSEQSAGVILQSLREVIAKAEGRTDEE